MQVELVNLVLYVHACLQSAPCLVGSLQLACVCPVGVWFSVEVPTHKSHIKRRTDTQVAHNQRADTQLKPSLRADTHMTHTQRALDTQVTHTLRADTEMTHRVH